MHQSNLYGIAFRHTDVHEDLEYKSKHAKIAVWSACDMHKSNLCGIAFRLALRSAVHKSPAKMECVQRGHTCSRLHAARLTMPTSVTRASLRRQDGGLRTRGLILLKNS